MNPCIVEDPCGPNAECFTIASRPECRCKSGFRGNPYDRCLVIGCRSNNDCPNDRACINGQCINPCVYEHPCSPQAECKVQNHFALCRCPPGMLGNPYVACRQEIQPECKEDAECPSLLACLDNVCRNPCTTLEPCKHPAHCVVINSLPVRTMVCECPSGYVSSGSGVCKTLPPITAVACTADTQCPSDKSCMNGRCIDPCNCGPNSECRVWDHKPVCSCLAGYDGNPEIDCTIGNLKNLLFRFQFVINRLIIDSFFQLDVEVNPIVPVKIRVSTEFAFPRVPRTDRLAVQQQNVTESITKLFANAHQDLLVIRK